jgi:bacterioferritin-associated ferredoxin
VSTHIPDGSLRRYVLPGVLAKCERIDDTTGTAGAPETRRAEAPETDMPVTRCVCHRLSFDDLKAVAASQGIGYDELKRQTRCASGCGMCEPYIRLMLITGETSFRVLTAAAIRKHLRDRGIDENALEQPARAGAAEPGRATA